MTTADKLATALIVARIGAAMAAVRLTGGPDLAQRLADIPTRGMPVSRPVTIHWNDYAIPLVEADTDEDAAFGLGVAHAHLRLGQMEIMRRLAAGRLAEMLGPGAVETDRGLRVLGFARTVERIVALMPEATRRWGASFADGITHYSAACRRLPPEFGMLGLEREPWTLADIVTIGRMASADCNWVILFNLLKLRDRPDWPDLWRALVDQEGASFRPPVGEGGADFGGIATCLSRSGSNAVAVAGSRTATGAALMAADPHLSLMLPNLWLVAGVRSPSHHAVGLMLPGLPFVAIGRNPWIAWSGTALQSASSDLFDARRLPASPTRRERIKVRGSNSREVEIRDTALGPLLSDAAILGLGDPVALKWMGHVPSDELSAWARMSQARDWPEFVAAADGIAVPGQNMVYADAKGHVGKVIACRLPRRPHAAQADAVLPPTEYRHWRTMISARDLPKVYDPASGIVASANERPRGGEVRVGLFFSAHDRFLRLHRLLAGRAKVALDDLAAMQRDVYSESAVEVKTWLCRHLDDHPLGGKLTRWDGDYDAESPYPTMFERMVGQLHDLVHGDAGQAAYWSSWDPMALMRKRLAAFDPVRLAGDLRRAADAVLRERNVGAPWGRFHRLRLAHVLGMLPGLGALFRFTDLPSAGGNETLMKTAHGLAGHGRHPVRFGANARFLADLSDPDRNRVVLLGGQDGWFGSANFLDQIELWRLGRAIDLPLRLETVRATFPFRTVLAP